MTDVICQMMQPLSAASCIGLLKLPCHAPKPLGAGEDGDEFFIDEEGNEVKMGTKNARELLEAAEQGEVGIVKRLLGQQAGTDCNESVLGVTPLMVACANGHDQVVTLLLEHGADVSAVDAEGLDAFGWADGNQTIVDILQRVKTGPTEGATATAATAKD